MTTTETTHYQVYGLRLTTDYRFRTPLAPADRSPSASQEVRFACRTTARARPLVHGQRVFSSREKNPRGESAVELYSDPPREVIRFPRVADFVLTAGSIECELLCPEHDYLVDICLLGHVLTYYCERRGMSAIHAGSVGIDGRAALFAADSRGGKSTIAASLVHAGRPLLADDICVLEPAGGQIVCHRGYPMFKMNDEQVRRFAPAADANEFELVHPGFAKVGVPVGCVGDFADRSLPVGAIYLLNRDPSVDAPICIQSVAPMEALMHLIRNSFIAELVDATDLRSDRLAGLSRIVKSVPVRRLSYPTGYDALPAVHRAVRDDLARGVAQWEG